jgi:hypothetical protein
MIKKKAQQTFLNAYHTSGPGLFKIDSTSEIC